MDMEKLVNEVAARVQKRIMESYAESAALTVNECATGKRIVLVNRKSCEDCSKCLKNELLQHGIHVTCSQSEKKLRADQKTDAIIALHMKEQDVMRIAAGVATDAYTEDLVAGLLQGIPVYVPMERAEFAGCAPAPAKRYRMLLEEKKQFLKTCGVRFMLEKEVIACLEKEKPIGDACNLECRNEPRKKRLLTEQTVRDAERQGKNQIVINRRTIITDLAKEYAHKRNITLIYCD